MHQWLYRTQGCNQYRNGEQQMNKDLQQKWADALRSGDYAQTTGTLKHKYSDSNESYCCLGVLACITGYEFELAPNSICTYRVVGEVTRDITQDNMLVNTIGFPSSRMLAKWELNKALAERLAALNDTDNTFEDIADIVEDLDNYEI